MSEKKITLIVGATTNPSRYAYSAAQLFYEKGIEFIPIGIKSGQVFGKEILDLRKKTIFRRDPYHHIIHWSSKSGRMDRLFDFIETSAYHF